MPVTNRERGRTRLDPEVRREQIVEAADRVFAGRDPAVVTFEEIAEAAGVSRALVYNYFGDKGGLVAAVYLRSFQRLDDELNAEVDGSQPPAERLREIVCRYLRFARSNASAWHLIGTAGATHHPAVQSARRKRFERMAGTWGGTPEARIVARGVVGLLEAATLDWLEGQDSDLEEVADVLYALLWSGLSSLSDHGISLPPYRPSPFVR